MHLQVMKPVVAAWGRVKQVFEIPAGGRFEHVLAVVKGQRGDTPATFLHLELKCNC